VIELVNTSASCFTVLFLGPIKITSPFGGEKWQEGTTQVITWTDSSIPKPYCPHHTNSEFEFPEGCSVYLAFYDITLIGKSFSQNLVTHFSGVPSYSWTIPGSLSLGSYNIKICKGDSNICTSSNTFNVVTGTATTLSVVKNSSFGDNMYSYSLGSKNVKLGSYVFTAGTSEGIKINSITIGLSYTTNLFQNLHLVIEGGNKSFGDTETTPTGDDIFYGHLFIPAGSSATIDVYADIPNSATRFNDVWTQILSCQTNSVISNVVISCPAN